MGWPALILLVEDSADTRETLSMVFSMHGYATHAVEHGEEALQWLRAGNRPAAIVLDLNMPVMSGDLFLRFAKGIPALTDIPVVAFTARDGDAPAGVTAFVRKGSDDPDVLVNAVEACLKA